jgi:hypothetical protein
VGVCGTSEDCLGYGFKECVELVMQVRRAAGRRGGTWEPMASFCRVSSPGGMVPASWPSGEGERVRQTRPCFHEGFLVSSLFEKTVLAAGALVGGATGDRVLVF